MKRRLTARKLGLFRKTDFVITVKTDNVGTTADNQFLLPSIGIGYDYEIITSDGQRIENLGNGDQIITFAEPGVYDIGIRGTFPRIFFIDDNDKLKITKIKQFGYVNQSNNQNNAYNGCSNITYIPDDNLDYLNSMVTAINMFRGCSITALPSGLLLTSLVNGGGMFSNTQLTTLPSGMELPLLSLGNAMFFNCSLTELPSGMELPLLENGNNMFSSNQLTALPSGMELPLLTFASSMFFTCPLTTLPSGMELPLLVNASRMFQNCALIELPGGMELPLLEDGSFIFSNNQLTSLPIDMKLPSLSNGNNMLLLNTLNTTRYSQLLIDLEQFNNNNNVTLNGGNSKYTTSGEVARNALISRGWVITDGGLEL